MRQDRYLKLWSQEQFLPGNSSIIFQCFEDTYMNCFLGLADLVGVRQRLDELNTFIQGRLQGFESIPSLDCPEADEALSLVEQSLLEWSEGLDDILESSPESLLQAMQSFHGWAEKTEADLRSGSTKLQQIAEGREE